jgi:hypothetical protein
MFGSQKLPTLAKTLVADAATLGRPLESRIDELEMLMLSFVSTRCPAPAKVAQARGRLRFDLVTGPVAVTCACCDSGKDKVSHRRRQ